MDTPMLFGPEHALQVAAEAVQQHAQSTDMAVGIILGVQGCIEEYARMVSTPVPDFPPNGKPASKPADKLSDKTEQELARR